MARPTQHPNCYPGTHVYVNKLDIRDPTKLEQYERILSSARMTTFPGRWPLTTTAYRSIHGHMLGSIYEWAGKYRHVDTGRLDETSNTPFCKAQFIDAQIEAKFSRIRSSIVPGMTGAEFAARAAEHLNEVNVIHAFLDGNGRVQRELLVAMGAVAGHRIDLSRIEAASWNHAAKVGFHADDLSPLESIVSRALDGPMPSTSRTARIRATSSEIKEASTWTGGTVRVGGTATARLLRALVGTASIHTLQAEGTTTRGPALLKELAGSDRGRSGTVLALEAGDVEAKLVRAAEEERTGKGGRRPAEGSGRPGRSEGIER